MGKRISDADKRKLLALSPDDITREFIEKTFITRFKAGKLIEPSINFQSEFSLKKGEYINTVDIPRTNVGLFIYNKLDKNLIIY